MAFFVIKSLKVLIFDTYHFIIFKNYLILVEN